MPGASRRLPGDFVNNMIIESLLDTDLYKFTMMQCVLHQFPGAEVAYRFRCRNVGVELGPYADEIRDELAAMGIILKDTREGVTWKRA